MKFRDMLLRHSGICTLDDNNGGGGGGGGGPEPKWFAALDADTQGFIQAKGLADKTPVEAFAEASRQAREAQQYIGVPADRVLKLPTTDNPDDWKPVWQRLGAQDEAGKYDYSGIKFSDNSDLDAEDVTFYQGLAHKLGLPLSTAQALVREVVARQEGEAKREVDSLAARVAEQKANLTTQWAQNFQANEFVAKQAMKAFGLSDEAIAAIENSPNYAATMETWRQIGTRIGEDKFVNGGGGGPRPPGAPMTLDEAKSKKTELMADEEWRKRFLAGGAEEKRTMTQIDTIIAGAAT